MPKRILCSYVVDFDAIARWPGSYGGQDSPSDISRGLFAGTHGVRRMLKLFDNKEGVTLFKISTICTDNGRLIEYINKHEGVEWVTMEQVYDEFKKKDKPPRGAVMPKSQHYTSISQYVWVIQGRIDCRRDRDPQASL
ncbi:hypothetical protein HYE67_001355 [Fusarium culmorum]|uniref:Uncharacterized protein n=1 Tax=Fusarium culmorum TaxID=5516 RepID=A0A7S8HSS6_FUSCU|nr:hypothetical protein HYE67_001355 [Fusarium culmorum]